MTIILSYYKCRDDWKDEGKHLQGWYAGMLEKKCGELKKQYPRQIFEKLPLVQDASLMRHILYGGVWQQYYAKFPGKEQKR